MSESKMTAYEYLGQNSEPIPTWLKQFEKGDTFNPDNFFSSRVVFYPGSGVDGQPVKLFGSTHSNHCFVYSDYGITENALGDELDDPEHGFHGYHSFARNRLSEKDLAPDGWQPHVDPTYTPPHGQGFINTSPFGFLEILERDQQFDDNHGPSRLAILFLGADGIATYDALFCQGNDINPPFATVLQDHGFGGNYDRFGRDGLMESIATNCGIFPKMILVAKHTDAWHGYEQIPNVKPDTGGMHGNQRYLYERQEI